FWLLHPVFFFQAEDGIRAFHVTGVQTCALPICPVRKRRIRCARVVAAPRWRRCGPVRLETPRHSADGAPSASSPRWSPARAVDCLARVARHIEVARRGRRSAPWRGHGRAGNRIGSVLTLSKSEISLRAQSNDRIGGRSGPL